MSIASHDHIPARRFGRANRSVHFGWVSLLQDLGSKMVVPIVPLFLALQLGASAFIVGLIDGVAAMSAAVVAPVAGRLATRYPVRMVRLGYGLSSAMKLALAGALSWPLVLAVRVADRAGKGIRDTPRDMLLADGSTAHHGRAFGIQQAMDKAGGFLGPIAGLLIYRLFGGSFNAVFVVAFIPCAMSVGLLRRIPPAASEERPPARPKISTAEGSTPGRTTSAQRRALVAVALHALGFVSASLLLLRAIGVDASVTDALIGFSALRLMTAVASYPVGRIVDAASARLIVTSGMFVSAGAVAVVGLSSNRTLLWCGLSAFGLADALTKAPIKVWLISLGPPASRGAVLGDRSAIAGVGALVGALATGFAWGDDGQLPLLIGASVAAAAALVAACVGDQPPPLTNTV